mmetsp:Transcript_25058/g.38891  ORF Transcript_25058/g.38891 Transcript_25058/m.38891 type:complete len:123 (-) Transcript_25058:97-465(-)
MMADSPNCLDALLFKTGRPEPQHSFKDIIDFKPLWAIKRSIENIARKTIEKETYVQPKHSSRPVSQRPSLNNRKEIQAFAPGRKSNFEEEDEEGENIDDEDEPADVPQNNTMSSIKCKPGIN